MRNLLIAIVCALSVGACNTVTELLGDSEFFNKAAETAGKVEDATVGNVAKGVSKYCGVIPGAGRKEIRDRLNGREEIKGAKVGVWCPGDAPLVLGP